jgi:hypothetical protein
VVDRSATGYPRSTHDTFARRLSSAEGVRRLVVAFCSTVILVAVAVRYPEAFRAANDAARANASLDYLDRQLGGGNSVLPDQAIALEARGLIPERGSFAVAVGPRRPGWSELAVPAVIDPFMRYFLLPRRPRDDAPWVLCFGCDRSAYPGARTVWEDDEGLSILRRPP